MAQRLFASRKSDTSFSEEYTQTIILWKQSLSSDLAQVSQQPRRNYSYSEESHIIKVFYAR